MTFDSSNALHFGQRFFQICLAIGVGHFWAIWPMGDPDDPCMTFDPINMLHSGQKFCWPIWWPKHIPKLGRLTSEWSLTFDGITSKTCKTCSSTSRAYPYPCTKFQYLRRSTAIGGHTDSNDLWPNTALHLDQGFFLPNLVAMGHL